ncbi:hypothetical protein BGM26_04955 [Bacillus sp. FJAT-29790]|nr:hypothetical protein [Bacillus sp. FJAT-29790]MBU8878336.1 hypothetical protein [Bacillus sp. FJAT-29790]
MNKQQVIICEDDKDMMHHLMAEQIAYICVEEEEERMKAELANHKGHVT